eukprot:13400310-Heterocapsa_arctica.AAC.1
MCGNVDEQTSLQLEAHCTGKGGFCSRTGKKQLRLEGTSPEGIAWTRIAQASSCATRLQPS